MFRVNPLLLPPFVTIDTSSDPSRSKKSPAFGSRLTVFLPVTESITGLSLGSKPPDADNQYVRAMRCERPTRNAAPMVVIAFQLAVRGNGARSIAIMYAFSIVSPGKESDGCPGQSVNSTRVPNHRFTHS